MASVENLREFVKDRLTAAAEEIFRVFKKTVIEYEQEIERQRRLLDMVCKPEIKLDSMALQQQHVYKEDDALAEQQLCNQERRFSLDQEEQEPSQIKEEEEELCTSQEEEQLVLKLETDTFILTPIYEQRNHSEPEPKSDQHLLSGHSCLAEGQNQKGDKQGDSGLTRDAVPDTRKNKSHCNNVYNPPLSEIHHNTLTELQQQHFCKEEEVPADQQLCNQERSSSLDQKEPEPPKIKEEEEEPCTSQEGEQLVLKMETDALMLTPIYEESEHSESEPKIYHQLLCNNSRVAESQDEKGSKHGDSRSTRDSDPETKKRHHKRERHSDRVYSPNMSDFHQSNPTSKKSFKCDTCGKDCKCMSKLNIHMRIHTGEKPYSCNTCGKRFNQTSALKAHRRIHTGERPYSCNTCGKRFNQTSGLKAHRRIHTGERPYSCNTCGKTFNQTSVLNAHIRIHTGEKPFSCKTCGRAFRYSGDLTVHMKRAHTGEKPYNCNTRGKRFSGVFEFSRHVKVHKGK